MSLSGTSLKIIQMENSHVDLICYLSEKNRRSSL